MKKATNTRPCSSKDIKDLLIIENLIFNSDKLNMRSFHHFIKKKDSIFVQEHNCSISGYGIILFRKNSFKARIYSLAIDPKIQGRGLGKLLLQYLERVALAKKMKFISLEVNTLNKKALSLYLGSGYVKVKLKERFYENGEDAFYLRKEI